MAHDAQVIGIAGHLAELTAERIDIVLIAEAEYPTALGARLDFNSHAVDDGFRLFTLANIEHLPGGTIDEDELFIGIDRKDSFVHRLQQRFLL